MASRTSLALLANGSVLVGWVTILCLHFYTFQVVSYMSGFLQNTNATENTNKNQGKSKQMSRCVGFLLWRKEQTEDHWSHTWVFDHCRCLLNLIFIFMFMMIVNAVVDGNYQWISWLRISASSSRAPPMHEKHTRTLYLCH